MSTSKNQRSGPKQVQVPRLCAKGHELVTVKRVPVIGHARLFFVCACDGYAPIDASRPYAQIKPVGLPGKKTDGRRSRGATVCS